MMSKSIAGFLIKQWLHPSHKNTYIPCAVSGEMSVDGLLSSVTKETRKKETMREAGQKRHPC